MQWIRSLYTNEILWLMVTIVLLCMNCAAVGAAVRLLHRKISLLKWITFTLTFTVIGYIAASAALFTVDWFGIRKALLLELAGTGGFTLVTALRRRKTGAPLWGELDTDLRPHLVPLFLVIVGLAVSWGNFGYFGMGQDQGVYQVKAINLMNAVNRRVYSFSEYSKLETEEEKEAFYQALLTYELGLDLIDDTWEENQVLASIRTGADDEHERTDGIFHGIPTYPALLALWGTVAGVGNMSGVQTFLYLLSLLTLWFTTENLKLKKGASALACVLFMLSPEVVWSSKSTLTEMLLALIMIRFLYDLTCPDPRRRWWSAWMVVMFALVHVSIFVMIFLFFVLYFLLYLWDGDRQYALALRISAAGFMGGFTFMTLVAPRYTIRNTAIIWAGPLTLGNIYWIFMGIGLAAFLLSFLLRRIPVRGRFRSFAGGNGCAWLIRCLVLLLLAASVLLSLRRAGGLSPEQVVTTNGMYNMIWMTGLVFLPVAIAALVRNPRSFLKDDSAMGIVVLFGFTVLLMCCILKSEISYCYYFGRYLTPYIPVACIFIGLVWTRYSGRVVCAGLAAGALVFAPFDTAMLWRQDDTFSSYEALSRVAGAVDTPDSAVILEDYPAMFMLPVKAMTGNECYFAEEDIESQAEKLAARYQKVYCITRSEKDWKIVTKITDSVFMDDNRSYRPPFCPFPLSFNRGFQRYNIYQYEGVRTFTAADLFSTAPAGGNAITLPKGQLQYGPYIDLPPGEYEVHFTGSNLSGAMFYPSVEKGIMLDYELLRREDSEAVIAFSSAVELEDVEFITKNLKDDPVTIEQISLICLSEP